MGTTHALAYVNAARIFGGDYAPELAVIADTNADAARNGAGNYGFKKWTTDWRDVVNDPEIELIDITTPNAHHVEIAVAAAKTGKHIYCEKPLAMDAKEARSAVAAVEKAGVFTLMGFNYLQNPAQLYAKKILDSGELGRVTSFRGTFDIDDTADANAPHSWRFLKKASATGALGDLASHTISIALALVGEIDSVAGATSIVFDKRPAPGNTGEMLPVENDDLTHFVFRYKNGALGTIASSRVASGRKMSLTYEIQATRGSLFFNQERMSEIKIYRSDDPAAEQGFRTVTLGPAHPEFAHFFRLAGLNIGYADAKTIEVHAILRAIAENRDTPYGFKLGCRVNQVIDAVLASSTSDRWMRVDDF